MSSSTTCSACCIRSRKRTRIHMKTGSLVAGLSVFELVCNLQVRTTVVLHKYSTRPGHRTLINSEQIAVK